MKTARDDRVTNLLSRRHIAMADVALIAEVGSTAHGIGVDGQDDLDLTVVRMEPWAEFVNGPLKKQSMMIRTQPDGVRSRVGDIDINVYTLRKFSNLALSGNPSILGALFSPGRMRDLQIIDALISRVPSQRAGSAFLGYMKQQMERWQGKRGQKNVNRPELVEAFGFDTKYAAHIIRLGHQGIEYVQSGRLTMPLVPDLAAAIRNLRTGGMTEQRALDWAANTEAELKSAIGLSTLPVHPNKAGVEAWLADAYDAWYRLEGGNR